MSWAYVFLVNLVSAAIIVGIHLEDDYMPWYLTAILCLNVVLLAASYLGNDIKNIERIEQLEKELQELKQEKGETK